MTIHVFSSTSEAYSRSQTDDSIRDGDVLEVPTEGVVGVMVQAWPTAVTVETGEFHALADGITWDELDGGRYSAAAAQALSLAG